MAMLQEQLKRAETSNRGLEKVRAEQAANISMLERVRGELSVHISKLEEVRI